MASDITKILKDPFCIGIERSPDVSGTGRPREEVPFCPKGEEEED